MRVLQARPVSGGGANAAVEQARRLGCDAIAWTLGEDQVKRADALAATRQAGLAAHAWFQVARDPEAARAHPEWMHAPQHHEWLQLFPIINTATPRGGALHRLNTVAAFEHALARTFGSCKTRPGPSASGWVTSRGRRWAVAAATMLPLVGQRARPKDRPHRLRTPRSPVPARVLCRSLLGAARQRPGSRAVPRVRAFS
jgi:hypothetical protein